ncbi:MAG TPA: cell wall-binding repeat-containing protein [Diaminobutyricibacter sp.]
MTVTTATVAGATPATAALPAYSATETIPAGSAPHGIAVDSTTGLVFVTDQTDDEMDGVGQVSVISTTTHARVGRIKVGLLPDAVTVDEATGTVYVANAGNPVDNITGSVSVIDESTNTVTATIPVGSQPEGIAMNTATHRVYVLNGAAGTVSVIDAHTNTVTNTIPVGSEPAGAAVDPLTDKLYVANASGSTISVIDGATNTVTATIGDAGGKPVGMAVNPSSGTVFVANANANTVTVIDEASDRIVSTITVGTAPVSVGVDPSTGTVYAVNQGVTGAGGHTVSIIDGAPRAVRATVGVGSIPAGVAVDPTTHTAYVTNLADDTLSVVSEQGGAPVITSAAPATVIARGTAYSSTVVGSGGLPLTYSVSSGTLPAGLSVNSATGVISGTPTTSGPYTYTVTTANGYGSGHATYTQHVAAVNRLAGTDRYQTSVAVAHQEFPATAPTVYVASGLNYPDALSAGPAAVKRGGPVLLTDPDRLPAEVAAEIHSLDPSTIVVMGGPGSVSTAVESQLQAAVPAANVSRVQGGDRYQTSQALVDSAFTSSSTIYVATGVNYPDALSAGGAAGSHGFPLLLVNGAATSVDSGTAGVLMRLGVTNIRIIGGTASISASLATALAAYGSVTRISGTDRYATAAAVNENAYSSASSVILANGLNFPDALSAAGWAGATASPLYLSPASCVSHAILSDFTRFGAGTVALVGGTAVLTAGVAALTPCP